MSQFASPVFKKRFARRKTTKRPFTFVHNFEEENALSVSKNQTVEQVGDRGLVVNIANVAQNAEGLSISEIVRQSPVPVLIAHKLTSPAEAQSPDGSSPDEQEQVSVQRRRSGRFRQPSAAFLNHRQYPTHSQQLRGPDEHYIGFQNDSSIDEEVSLVDESEQKRKGTAKKQKAATAQTSSTSRLSSAKRKRLYKTLESTDFPELSPSSEAVVGKKSKVHDGGDSLLHLRGQLQSDPLTKAHSSRVTPEASASKTTATHSERKKTAISSARNQNKGKQIKALEKTPLTTNDDDPKLSFAQQKSQNKILNHAKAISLSGRKDGMPKQRVVAADASKTKAADRNFSSAEVINRKIERDIHQQQKGTEPRVSRRTPELSSAKKRKAKDGNTNAKKAIASEKSALLQGRDVQRKSSSAVLQPLKKQSAAETSMLLSSKIAPSSFRKAASDVRVQRAVAAKATLTQKVLTNSSRNPKKASDSCSDVSGPSPRKARRVNQSNVVSASLPSSRNVKTSHSNGRASPSKSAKTKHTESTSCKQNTTTKRRTPHRTAENTSIPITSLVQKASAPVRKVTNDQSQPKSPRRFFSDPERTPKKLVKNQIVGVAKKNPKNASASFWKTSRRSSREVKLRQRKNSNDHVASSVYDDATFGDDQSDSSLSGQQSKENKRKFRHPVKSKDSCEMKNERSSKVVTELDVIIGMLQNTESEIVDDGRMSRHSQSQVHKAFNFTRKQLQQTLTQVLDIKELTAKVNKLKFRYKAMSMESKENIQQKCIFAIDLKGLSSRGMNADIVRIDKWMKNFKTFRQKAT